jgi:hypothetical protein
MQGNLRSINLQHSFEVETLDREKLAVGEERSEGTGQ